jgi:hypothetical protein
MDAQSFDGVIPSEARNLLLQFLGGRSFSSDIPDRNYRGFSP